MQSFQEQYGSSYKWTYIKLRKAVEEAWEAITEEQLRELLNTMPQRMMDTIAAKGGHTKW
ncbi:hypothetical protein B0J12DRAFT_692429 [Macrophomina phaseolina]|uniref:Uncharacterized protein n=1 Tax=Macrophomina phaseolina TaxID=35725 RepID=A0ABQ8FS86_9PEZI|nr:hypothetical protein B0J12DRAFT_692429 [Macrophomina phaseolina]